MKIQSATILAASSLTTAMSVMRSPSFSLGVADFDARVKKSPSPSVSLISDAPEGKKKEYPVTRVVNILKAMRDDNAKKGDEDAALYKKIKCWADTNRKEKTQQISDGEDKAKSLGAAIEEGEATTARLDDEIKNLGEEIEEKTQSLDEATKIRSKENAEFHEEAKELAASIAALRGAITVLKRHHGKKDAAAFISKFLSSHSVTTMRKDSMLDSYNYRRSKMEAVLTQLTRDEPPKNDEEEEGYFGKSAIGQSNYNSASGEIFGMLNQMLDDMIKDEKQGQEEEANALTNFNQLKESLETEISEATNSKDSKTAENGKVLEKLGIDKQDLVDTNKDLEANKTYLADLEKTWAETDEQYQLRLKSRAEEDKAIGEAIKILTSDEARDLFSSHFDKKTSFLQLGTKASKINSAISYLQKHGVAGANKLTAIAMVSLDAFEKVKEAIDDMIADLKTQSANEIKQRDYCISELNEKEKEIMAETHTKESAESEVAAAEDAIENLQSEILKLNEEIKELDVAIKVAGEDRSAENKEFQEMVDEQVAVVKILNKALKVLEKVYGGPLPGEEKSGAESLLSQPVGPNAPKGFDPYVKQSGGVLGVLRAIITESETMKKEAITAEQGSQANYEKFVQESNLNRQTKMDSVVNKTKKKGEVETALETAKEKLQASSEALVNLLEQQKTLKNTCDFLLSNFETIQEARANEIDALKTAKSILSGQK